MATRVGASNPTAAATAARNAQNAQNAQNTTGATATTATNATTNDATVDPSQLGDPNLTGAPAVMKREVSGLPKDFDLDAATKGGNSWMSTDGLRQAATGDYIITGANGYNAGYTDIDKVSPTSDGFQLDYSTYTKDKDEKGVMLLYFPIRDAKSGELSYLPLDVLSMAKPGEFLDNMGDTKGKNADGKDVNVSRRSIQFSLKQINDHIKGLGLDLPALQPGDQLALTGIMHGSRHRIANSASNSFQIPAPTSQGAASNPLMAQIGNATNQSVQAKDLPLDVTAKIPQNILDMPIRYGSKKIGDVLEGEVTTRLESEYKGSVSKDQMETMLDQAYELSALSEKADGGDAAARAELDKRLGPGLKIAPMKRHWVDEAGVALGNGGDETKVARDAKGRPKLDTMIDAYSDVKDMTWTKISGAIRMRGNAQKSGHAEFKLGGGVLDPSTGIRQRTELGMSTKPGTSDQDLTDVLGAFADRTKAPHYSIGGHLIREAEELGLEKALLQGRSQWADVRQDRHKFEIEDVKSGVKAELSLDTVTATTTRPEHQVDGKPQTETFYVVESELDHLQINSDNVTDAQDVSKKSAIISSDDLTTFIDEKKKEVASGDVEFEAMRQPTLHGKEHVDEGSFRKTDDYKIFEKMNKAILDATTPGFEPGPARQKAAHFAELLGLVPPEGTAVS